jgi:integrase
MKQVITDSLIRRLKPPARGRIEVADLRCSGLAFRLTARGVRSWCFRFRDAATGKSARAIIGRYPDVGLSKARARAAAMRADVASGINPTERKRRERADATGKTFGALAARYLAEHARRKKRTADQDEANLKRHVLPKWKSRSYASIGRADVIELVEGLVKAGKPVQANRIQSLISSVFSFAIDSALLSANPCSRLRKRGAERAGRRVLSDPEIQLFWDGIIEPPVSPLVGLALRLELLTGARSGEVVGLARNELEHLRDDARAAWTIPAERVKNKRTHFLPLSPAARDVVLELLDLANTDAEARGAKPADPRERFLLPSRTRHGATMTNTTLATAMRRFGAAVSDGDAALTWRADPPSPHDLRRTVETGLSRLGISKEDRDAVLNHAPARSDTGARHYDLYTRAAEKRRALCTWANAIAAVVTTSGNGAVVPITAGKRR